MPTNKVVLNTVEQFMLGYTPVYQPMYPLFLGKSQAYSEEVGKINFNRLDTVGDLRAKSITPKDTEIRQIAVKNSAKTFKKYFLANQYVQSALQAIEDIEGITAQVLDEHQKQFDELVLLGEGTAANNVVNNGLFWSSDANYSLAGSEQLRNDPDTQNDYYDLMMSSLSAARDLSGQKAIIIYGGTALSKLDSLLPGLATSLRSLIEESLGPDAKIIRMPSAVTPAGANGWIAVNLDQVKMHYTTLPSLKNQGVNDEKMYSWHNFLMGSAMIEVLAPNGVIRQPVTFEA